MIRKAIIDDINTINILGEKLHNNFKKTFHIETEINNEFATVLVCELDCKVVGYVYAINLIDNFDLLSLFVSEDYRNNNVGKMLVTKLQETVKDKPILLEVSDKNINAINLYNKTGFEIINVRKKYYEDSDALIMRWK